MGPEDRLSLASTRAPTLGEIRSQSTRLEPWIRRTPILSWRDHDGSVTLKLELMQHAGSFKARGAISVMLELDRAQLDRGVVAVSAGNHAMAVGYAARVLDSSAHVVMPRSANPARVEGCRAFGTEVELVDDVHAAFARVREIEHSEGRWFVHPFEGPMTAVGAATVGLELVEQAPALDAVIVPIGGGGLCAGVATAVKLASPACRVYGVEPEGADSMHRSFASGQPEAIGDVRTIADSLGAPHAAPYSFGLCKQHVDRLVRVDDRMLCEAMAFLFHRAKLAVEPAGAASTAALHGPLRDELTGKNVGLIVCGANIDAPSFARFIAAGEDHRAP